MKKILIVLGVGALAVALAIVAYAVIIVRSLPH